METIPGKLMGHTVRREMPRLVASNEATLLVCASVAKDEPGRGLMAMWPAMWPAYKCLG